VANPPENYDGHRAFDFATGVTENSPLVQRRKGSVNVIDQMHYSRTLSFAV
jgi:hypothetical protein